MMSIILVSNFNVISFKYCNIVKITIVVVN